MTRRITFEIGAIPARFLVDGREVVSAPNASELLKLADYVIAEGDSIEIDDPAYVQHFCRARTIDAALEHRLEEAQGDWEGEADQVVNVDLGATLNGSPLFGVPSPVFDFPVTAPVEPVCEVRLSGFLYGAWTTVLLVGGDLAVFSYRAEEGDLEWDSERGVENLSVALGMLTDRAVQERYFPSCPTCARDYDEQSWGIDIYPYVALSDELKVQMLNALWAPCEDHPSATLSAFDARWAWSGKSWAQLA